MANHDFQDVDETLAETKKAYRKELTQEAGRLVAQLAAFKGKYDALYALSTAGQQANLTTKFNEFKLDAKNALGL